MEEQLLENGEKNRWIITKTYYQELKKLWRSTNSGVLGVAISVANYIDDDGWIS